MNGMGQTKRLTEIEESTIFKNYEILTPDYIPTRLIARDEQIESVRKILKPIVRYRGKPHNAILYGATGLGKTATIKYILNELKEAIEKNNLNNYVPIYINCNNNNISSILFSIIATLDPDTKFPSTGYAIKRYYDEIFKIMNEMKISLILTLDEIDLLKENMLLYELCRAGGDKLEPGQHIGIIGITNKLQWGDDLDGRILSTWNAQKIIFPKYDSYQLSEILNERKGAFAEGIVDDDVIKHIAAITALESGDARKAIEILRLCGEYVDDNELDKITADIIPIANDQMDIDQMASAISSLQRHAKEALAGIVKAIDINNGKEIQTGDAMQIYQRFCEMRKLKPVSRTKFSSIISELDTMGIITANYRNSRGRGKTRGISLNIDPTMAIECLVASAHETDYYEIMETDIESIQTLL